MIQITKHIIFALYVNCQKFFFNLMVFQISHKGPRYNMTFTLFKKKQPLGLCRKITWICSFLVLYIINVKNLIWPGWLVFEIVIKKTLNKKKQNLITVKTKVQKLLKCSNDRDDLLEIVFSFSFCNCSTSNFKIPLKNVKCTIFVTFLFTYLILIF